MAAHRHRMDGSLLPHSTGRTRASQWFCIQERCQGNTDWTFTDERFSYQDKGKPYVLDPPSAEHGWSFNLSHSGDYVVFGAERGCLLGIDVMRTDYPSRKSLQDYFQLMKSQFTPREWTLITSAPSESDELRNFYRLWCLKESYVKALGIGIGYSVSQLDFHLPPAPAPITLDIAGVRQSDWIFREFCIGEQHVGAVALQAPPGVLENRAEPTLISREIEEVIAGLAPLHKVNEEVGKRFIGKAERPESVGEIAVASRPNAESLNNNKTIPHQKESPTVWHSLLARQFDNKRSSDSKNILMLEK
ncbi:L-aminoadipate-semialdehyde dehydrogenase-phosphopantetheinyl transferase-like isoform X2 [Paramacrobiotus metropolitanus]|uniref:L-aminoadipate-semialdehyde dehydrogenase-phosphopantetheinyl transferase-like isoform X2 n=1 Tax=Paramacrobiotus metropolitanus TaxID=2943436 RepID=UPI002445C8F9|nr:L-aminoadipate-semialdehyde dehydrogenase-phosphopantetheinyl transferase-like isoform X2 [Paramacrobiotus metropolitanus]XP_055345670.1 L-aminoadipate-semialdehyde dehydrogenase-phosphopantetheinyl transferase-like isoform X2 [Paramacrobiotus metropolitanus]